MRDFHRPSGRVIATVFGGVLFLLAGCFGYSDREAEALRQAMKKVTLPPGSLEMRIGGDSMPASFYVVAPYTGVSEEELLQFYVTWFDKSGWTARNPEEESQSAVLSYVKEGSLMTVSVRDANPALHLVVTYTESGSEAPTVPDSLHFLDPIVNGDTLSPTSTP